MPRPTTHQTARLKPGKHRSPDEGASVMELASMLAGERFGDAPESVCPVIGSFLRTYNDLVDEDRRQDLYAYAAKVVGTGSTRVVEHRRTERCLAWARSLPHGRGRFPPITGRPVDVALFGAATHARPGCGEAGRRSRPP